MCNPYLLWFPLTDRHFSFLIFQFSSFISHLSSELEGPCLLCLIDGAKLHKKPMPSGKSVNNPTFRQLSVFSILFSVKSPSNRLLLAHRPPQNLLGRILQSNCSEYKHLQCGNYPCSYSASFMVVHKPRRQVIVIIVLFSLFISQPTIRIRERLLVFLFGSENHPWDSNQVNFSDVWNIEIDFSDNLGPRGPLIHGSESGKSGVLWSYFRIREPSVPSPDPLCWKRYNSFLTSSMLMSTPWAICSTVSPIAWRRRTVSIFSFRTPLRSAVFSTL